MTLRPCPCHTDSMPKFLPADRFGNPPEWIPENEDADVEDVEAVTFTGPLPVGFAEDEGPF